MFPTIVGKLCCPYIIFKECIFSSPLWIGKSKIMQFVSVWCLVFRERLRCSMTHSQSLRIMGMVMSPGPSLLSTVFHLSGFSSYLLYLSVPSSPNRAVFKDQKKFAKVCKRTVYYIYVMKNGDSWQKRKCSRNHWANIKHTLKRHCQNIICSILLRTFLLTLNEKFKTLVKTPV